MNDFKRIYSEILHREGSEKLVFLKRPCRSQASFKRQGSYYRRYDITTEDNHNTPSQYKHIKVRLLGTGTAFY